eukprot:jgi/Chrzof1/415/Cz01g15030.t1
MQDAVHGRLLLVFCPLAFVYCTFWLIFTPFVEEGHVVLKLFLPTTYAYFPVCLAIVTGFSLVVGYVGLLFLQEGLAQP